MDYSEKPLINWLEPIEEREIALHINHQLGSLVTHVTFFERSVTLIDNCLDLTEQVRLKNPNDIESKRLFGDWMIIAARDAAMTLYHFQSVVRSIRDQLHRAPALQRKVNTKALEVAYRRFEEEFPNWKAVRDAVGHWADMAFKPEEEAKHRIPDGVYAQSVFSPLERKLIMTRNKRHQTLEISHEAAAVLTSVARDVFAAFPTIPSRPSGWRTSRPKPTDQPPSPE